MTEHLTPETARAAILGVIEDRLAAEQAATIRVLIPVIADLPLCLHCHTLMAGFLTQTAEGLEEQAARPAARTKQDTR